MSRRIVSVAAVLLMVLAVLALPLAIAQTPATSRLALPQSGTATAGNQEDQEQREEKAKKAQVDQMPEGQGKELVVSRCTVCHSLSGIVGGRRDAESWGRIVAYMLALGVELSPEEVKIVVKYLGASFPPLININRATVQELSALLSVDTKLAGAIVRYRNENGSFATVDDVAKVKGLSPEVFGKIKSLITTGSTTSPNPSGAANNNATTDNSNKEKK